MKNSIKILLAVLFASTLVVSCGEKKEQATEEATPATTEAPAAEATPVTADSAAPAAH